MDHNKSYININDDREDSIEPNGFKAINKQIISKRYYLSVFLIGIAIVLILSIVALCNHYGYSGELIGINGTSTYHRDNCQFVRKANSKDYIFFKDLNAAAEAGYRACKTCRPPANDTIIAKVIERKKSEEKAHIDELAVKIKEGEPINFLAYDEYVALIQYYPDLESKIKKTFNTDDILDDPNYTGVIYDWQEKTGPQKGFLPKDK